MMSVERRQARIYYRSCVLKRCVQSDIENEFVLEHQTKNNIVDSDRR